MSRMRACFAAMVAPALLAGATAVAVIGGMSPAGADPIAVTNTADDGNDSLRDVIENDAANDATIVLAAGATYVLDDCKEGEIEVDIDLTIEGNGATIKQECLSRVILLRSSALVLDGVTIRGGREVNEGGGIQMTGEGESLVVRDSTFTDNLVCDEGAAISSEDGGNVTVIRSTIAGNSGEEEPAVDMDDDGALLMVNSTVTGNTSNGDGAISIENGAIGTLVYSTIARNTHGGFECPPELESLNTAEPEGDDVDAAADEEPANLSADIDNDSNYFLFGTVIAEPLGTAPNCNGDDDPLDNTVSSGYNFSDDDSCDLTASTDKSNGGSPVLGALANNSGPTQTMLPQTGSPLINAVPIASCSGGDTLVGDAVTTDQRGVTRPQETGCEIGSVEIEAPSPPEVVPTFTG